MKPYQVVISAQYTAFYRVNAVQQHVEILHIVNLGKPLSVRNIEF